MENEKWKCECGFEVETDFCPNCGRGKDGLLPEEMAENNVEEQPKTETETTEEVIEQASEDQPETKTETVPTETEEVNQEETVKSKKNSDKERVAMLKEIRSLKKQVVDLREQLAAEKAANRRMITTPQKALNIRNINVHYAKSFMSKWPILIMAILMSAVSLLAFTKLISFFNWIVLVETLFLLPVEVVATVGLWKMFASGVSNREDLDFGKGPSLIKKALKATKVYILVIMAIACVGIVVLMLAANGALDFIGGQKLLDVLPFTINIDFWSAVIVLLLCALAFAFVAVFFTLLNKMIDSAVNRAKNGKEYYLNCTVLAIFTFVLGIVTLVVAYVFNAGAETFGELIAGLNIDIASLINAPSIINVFASGIILILIGVQALIYNKIQTNVDEEIDSLDK